MNILVIPTTDWTGHPVPNRLNFIFDRLTEKHNVDVCHFKLFDNKSRNTKCDLIEMDEEKGKEISSYYLRNSLKHGKKILDMSDKYDIIVSANIVPSFFANMQDTPIIFDFMDYLPESASIYYDRPVNIIAKNTANLITRYNLKMAKGIITPTIQFKEFLSRYTSVPIRVVPNGVDTSVIKKTDSINIEITYSLEHPVLGYVGSLEEWIDLDYVIDRFIDVKKRYPRAKLMIIGPSLHTDYSDRLRDKVESLHLRDDVIFTGRIPYENLGIYISALDVGLNPRKDLKMNRMTMGSKVLNYLACGVPVLSSNMPAIEKEFGEEKGVFTYHNEEEFMGELHKAITKEVNPDVVRDYDWDRLAKRYEKVIQEFIV